MRIMNGNDSVVKCLCFFRFLLSILDPPHPQVFIYTAAQGSVTGVVLHGHRPTEWFDGRWTPSCGNYLFVGNFHLFAANTSDEVEKETSIR